MLQMLSVSLKRSGDVGWRTSVLVAWELLSEKASFFFFIDKEEAAVGKVPSTLILAAVLSQQRTTLTPNQ